MSTRPESGPRFIVAAAQLRVTPDDPRRPLPQLDVGCAEAAARGAALVALPEAFVPGYRWVPGDAELAARVRHAAREAAARHGLCLALGHVDALGSALLLAAPDGRTWTYHKRFIAVGEAAVWRAGREAVVAEIGPALGIGAGRGRVGLLVCADVLQPAAWHGLRDHVDLLVVAAAWPDYRGRAASSLLPLRPVVTALGRHSAAHRDRVLAALARHLGVPVVFANAVGPWRHDEGFTGGSAVIDGEGRTLVRAGGTEPELIAANVSTTGARAARSRAPRQPVSWRLFNAANRTVASGRQGLMALRRLFTTGQDRRFDT
jgi:N-carbamoylputrescine amidase